VCPGDFGGQPPFLGFFFNFLGFFKKIISKPPKFSRPYKKNFKPPSKYFKIRPFVCAAKNYWSVVRKRLPTTEIVHKIVKTITIVCPLIPVQTKKTTSKFQTIVSTSQAQKYFKARKIKFYEHAE